MHLLQRVKEGYEWGAAEMGDGAQPREQTLVQHLLEVPLTDVLQERPVHVRQATKAWRPLPSCSQHGTHQHGGAQVELLSQLCDVDVHRHQLIPVCLLHLTDDVRQPLKLPLRARHPDEIDLWKSGVRLSLGLGPLTHAWRSSL